MKNTIKKPYCTLNLCEPTKHFSVCVCLDGERVHKVTNLMKFSKEIGYPDLSEKVFKNKGNCCKDRTLLVESKEIEYANCADATEADIALNACFQFRIAKYLFKNCEAFKEKYAGYYASLMGTCTYYGIINAAKFKACYLHPSKNSQCAKV